MANRIIPARAGFTDRGRGARAGGGDHPRSRGVYGRVSSAVGTGVGSSPLARGLPQVHRLEELVGGIIPARAGFTEGPPAAVPARRDHPRSRGVYLVALLRAAPQQRIIPARAGFTRPCAPAGSRCRDHPRSRGVYPPFIHTDLRNTGSSPLARGLPLQHRQVRHRPGIIPARAGFTSPPASPRAWSTDHPRSRGVYGRRCTLPDRRGGSSPLARGLLVSIGERIAARGIIPARAGFTVQDLSGLRRPADHPRSRGVYGFDKAA